MRILNNMKFVLKIILVIGLVLVGYCIFICVLGIINSLNIQQWAPEEGVWYCRELQIQMSFDEEVNSYAVIDNDTVLCAAGYERGSEYITVGIQEENVPGYSLGEKIFFGKYVARTENEYIVEEVSSGIEYTFERIG